MLKSQWNERASIMEVTIIGVDLAKNVFQLHGAAADGTVVACGEIGGYLYEDEDLYIGLRGQNGSGVAGIALIEGDDDDAELDVTIFLVTDAASGAAATATS